MKYRKLTGTNLRADFYFVLISILVIALSACQSSQSTVSNSPAQPAQTAQPVAATPAPIELPSPSPGSTQTTKKTGTTDNVPEIMRRPMTKEEMDKALQALPPEVRARLQGMGMRPANPKATPTPKK
jgi:hypothetical protein